MSALAVVTAVALSALLVVTACVQRARWGWAKAIKARDAFALIPAWTFFAPNPGVTDTRVLWRERLLDGTIGPWHEVVPPPSGRARGVWNPTKRSRKAVTDAGPQILRLARRRPDSLLPLLSLPYLMLANHVNHAPGSSLATHRQIAMVRTQGPDADEDGMLEVLFLGHWFAHEGATAPAREVLAA